MSHKKTSLGQICVESLSFSRFYSITLFLYSRLIKPYRKASYARIAPVTVSLIWFLSSVALQRKSTVRSERTLQTRPSGKCWSKSACRRKSTTTSWRISNLQWVQREPSRRRRTPSRPDWPDEADNSRPILRSASARRSALWEKGQWSLYYYVKHAQGGTETLRRRSWAVLYSHTLNFLPVQRWTQVFYLF